MPAPSTRSRTWWLIGSALASLAMGCGGQDPDALALGLGARDASSIAPPDAAIPTPAKSAIDAAPPPPPSLGAPAACLPRDAALDAGPAARCESSRDCVQGSICCARAGETVGECSQTACGGATPQQRCTADCECLVGRCRNAWPYMPYGDCG